jgi:hypothetical protein
MTHKRIFLISQTATGLWSCLWQLELALALLLSLSLSEEVFNKTRSRTTSYPRMPPAKKAHVERKQGDRST